MKYRIIGGNDDKNFEINEDTGVVYTTKKLDYETKPEYSLQVASFNIKPFQGPTAATLGNPVVNLVVKVQVSARRRKLATDDGLQMLWPTDRSWSSVDRGRPVFFTARSAVDERPAFQRPAGCDDCSSQIILSSLTCRT